MDKIELKGSISDLNHEVICNNLLSSRINEPARLSRVGTIAFNVVIFLVTFVLFQMWRDPFIDVPAVAFIAVAVFWVGILIQRQRAHKSALFKSIGTALIRQGEKQYTLDPSGLKIDGEYNSEFLKWDCFSEARITKQAILLIIGRIEYHAIPRSAFESESDLLDNVAQIEAWIEASKT